MSGWSCWRRRSTQNQQAPRKRSKGQRPNGASSGTRAWAAHSIATARSSRANRRRPSGAMPNSSTSVPHDVVDQLVSVAQSQGVQLLRAEMLVTTPQSFVFPRGWTGSGHRPDRKPSLEYLDVDPSHLQDYREIMRRYIGPAASKLVAMGKLGTFRTMETAAVLFQEAFLGANWNQIHLSEVVWLDTARASCSGPSARGAGSAARSIRATWRGFSRPWRRRPGGRGPGPSALRGGTTGCDAIRRVEITRYGGPLHRQVGRTARRGGETPCCRNGSERRHREPAFARTLAAMGIFRSRSRFGASSVR